ncbi:hypothetical protein BN9982_1540014 [Mycobacterium tuberculosis]|nr:hypothetical protein BN9982_1540014 [Mycobacterium tuberculosis]
MWPLVIGSPAALRRLVAVAGSRPVLPTLAHAIRVAGWA